MVLTKDHFIKDMMKKAVQSFSKQLSPIDPKVKHIAPMIRWLDANFDKYFERLSYC